MRKIVRKRGPIISFVAFITMYCLIAVNGQNPVQPQLELVVQTGHNFSVESVALSPDGNIVATASLDNTIKVWDAASGRQLKSLEGHTGAVNQVTFSQDGSTIVSGSSDKTIRFWDAKTGRELRSLDGHMGEVESIALTPDGSRIVSAGGADNTIKVWDAATGRQLMSLKGQQDWHHFAAFSPDGSKIVSGSWDETIRLWDANTGRQLRSLQGHVDRVESVAFSPDGSKIVSGSNDKTVRLWDAATGRELRTLAGHTDTVNSVVFSPDGSRIVSGSSDKTIRFWDAATGRQIKSLLGHTGWVNSIAVSPSGKNIVSGSRDNTIKVWDAATGRELKSLEGHTRSVNAVASSPDGSRIVSGSGFGDNTIVMWDAATGRGFKSMKGHKGPVVSIAFSPDGMSIVSGSHDNTVRVWDAETGRQIKSLVGHTDWVISVAFSPDGRRIASGGLDNTIKLWDTASGRQLKSLEGHAEGIRSAAFSPDGKRIVSGSSDKTIKLWDAESGKEIWSRNGHTFWVNSVAFSPDGNKIVSGGSREETIKLWDAATGLQLKSLEGHTDTVDSVAFSPDGSRIVSGSWDHTVKIWDPESGRLIKSLAGHTGWVHSVAFSADGSTIVSGSDDQSIRLWEADDKNQSTEIAALIALENDDWAVVTPGGRFDTSDGALNQMHYAYGFEVIELEQLKEAFYEPGLLAKLLGFSKESFRSIVPLKDVRLYPEVVDQKFDDNTAKLTLKLKSRGGGIGETRILVNGKQAVADARDAKTKANPEVPAGQIVTLTTDLSGVSFLKGKQNDIRVVTSNYLNEIGKGNIQSRGVETTYIGKGQEEFNLPSLYAIVGGVSDYEGNDIDLRFAAKDAEDFSNALSLGAKRLFCPKENPQCLDKVQITTLSTSRQEINEQPTKENFRNAFADIAKKAKPEDIVVIYLAGHGVSFGSGTDTYFYLTKEARTASKNELEKVYKTVAISSTELTDWLTTKEWNKGEKGIKALKQVMILDTCAAGKAAKDLPLPDGRDLTSDQIRAIEFLKDKTGTFVLMGSTADQPSYESSPYGQGLLTYSLLQAMKGAELSSGGFVDVRTLFSYAERTVPNLATNVGGVQNPIISAPLGKTFVIGQMTEEDRKKIELPSPKPIMLRPSLGVSPINNDPLQLNAALRKILDYESSYAIVSARGDREPVFVFIDHDNFPDAIRVTGSYIEKGNVVTLKAYVVKNEKVLLDLPEITAEKEKALQQLVNFVQEWIAEEEKSESG